MKKSNLFRIGKLALVITAIVYSIGLLDVIKAWTWKQFIPADSVFVNLVYGYGWGGGWVTVDYCPAGDFSPSYYDDECGSVEVVEVVSAGEVENNLIWENGYSEEFNQAYNFAKENGITTMASIQEANMEGTLARSHMAKMMVNYAINVLGKTLDTSKSCEFNDIANASQEVKDYAIKACQLGIMGINTPDFMPNNTVTRAQFGTVLSRLLYNTPNAGSPYYLVHLNVLKAKGIITDTNPNLMEMRAYIMIMLMNAAK